MGWLLSSGHAESVRDRVGLIKDGTRCFDQGVQMSFHTAAAYALNETEAPRNGFGCGGGTPDPA